MTEPGPTETDPLPRLGAARLSAGTRVSLPGTDMPESLRMLRGELGDPHQGALPVLPETGWAGTRLARTVATLGGLSADLQAAGWRLRESPGREARTAAARLSSDVQALADAIGAESAGHRGTTVVDLIGPLSLAAELHLGEGRAVVADHGARRDLREAQRAGLADLVRALRTALDGEELFLRVREPRAEEVLAGRVPTASGLRTLRAVPRGEARAALSELALAARSLGLGTILDQGGPVPDPDLRAEFDAVAVRPASTDPRDWEAAAAAHDTGLGLRLGVLTGPDTRGRLPDPGREAAALWRTWRSLGLGQEHLRGIALEERADLDPVAPERVASLLGVGARTAQILAELAAEDAE